LTLSKRKLSKKELFLKRRLRVRNKLKKIRTSNKTVSFSNSSLNGLISTEKAGRAISDSLAGKLKDLSVEVVEVSSGGVCYAIDGKQRTFAFKLDKIESYSGERPSEIGLAAGREVTISVRDGTVVRAVPG